MIYLKTEDEIELLRKANLLVSQTLTEIAKMLKPGVTTLALDTVAEQVIRDNGGTPVFKGFPNPYGSPLPASICASPNNIVVHGVPDNRELRDGDILSVDCGACLEGFCGDSCYTFCVGDVKPEVRQLLKTTKEALYKGIEAALPGRRIGDIGYAVQQHCEAQGYSVVREFVGHGVGREMHEDPAVPNYGNRGAGKQIKNGLCIAIEPMIAMGQREIAMLSDKWSITTRDGKPAAHFEHSIAIHNGKPDILSSFAEIEIIEGKQY